MPEYGEKTICHHVTRLGTSQLTRRVYSEVMIIPLTLPRKSSSNGTEPALPSALAQLGSSEYFLLELQGELEVSGDKHGQLVGRLTIDDTNDGKVRLDMSRNPSQ